MKIILALFALLAVSACATTSTETAFVPKQEKWCNSHNFNQEEFYAYFSL